MKDFTIIRELGRGGMSIVYLAEHQLLKTQVAIKKINDDFFLNKNIKQRFIAEARKMAQMSHPNIVKVTDLFYESDSVAFVMEYVKGETLRDYIDRKGRLSDDEVESLFKQMLDAVGYVHTQSLVHRDIKPSNFMVDTEGKIKLMDFGIAKEMDHNSAEYTMTGTSVRMGTPMYMSPEQVKSSKHVTYQTDIYSLGVVLWQMVSGRKPYDQNELSIPEIQVKIIKEPLPNLNSKWDPIIQKATQKDPRMRNAYVVEMFNTFGRSVKFVDSGIIDDKTTIESKINEGVVLDEDRFSKQEKEKTIDNSQKNTNIKVGNTKANPLFVTGGWLLLFFSALLPYMAYYRIHIVQDNYYPEELYFGFLLSIPGVILLLISKQNK